LPCLASSTTREVRCFFPELVSVPQIADAISQRAARWGYS
jgi:hypothetical protein